MGKKYFGGFRYGHVGKSNQDKENYRRLINAPQERINDTFTDEDKEDLGSSSISDSAKPSISNVQGIKPTEKARKPKTPKPYKSIETIITDNIKQIIFGVIVLGVISLCVSIVWSQQRELGKIDSNITSIAKDVEKLQDKYDKTNEGDFNSNNSISQIKVDLEYIKQRLQKLETRMGL